MKAALALLSFVLFAPLAASQDFLACSLAPGWQPIGAARSYAAENLWEYKDGAAEGYLSFGFVRLRGVSCRSGAKTLDIDISEMQDADAAWGIFAANADATQPFTRIGMAGQVQPLSASFAKGPWYVEINEVTGNLDANDSAALLALTTAIDGRLQGRTTPPEVIGWFPSEGLVSVRLAPQSVLGLHELQRGYVARYGQSQAFIAEESSAQAAEAVLTSLRARFPGAAEAQVGEQGFRTEEKYLGGICIFQIGRFVAGYANLPDSAAALAAALQLAPRIPQKRAAEIH